MDMMMMLYVFLRLSSFLFFFLFFFVFDENTMVLQTTWPKIRYSYSGPGVKRGKDQVGKTRQSIPGATDHTAFCSPQYHDRYAIMIQERLDVHIQTSFVVFIKA